MFRVLERLGSVLGFVHLDRFPDSLKSLVQTVSEIPLLGFELRSIDGNVREDSGWSVEL